MIRCHQSSPLRKGVPLLFDQISARSFRSAPFRWTSSDLICSLTRSHIIYLCEIFLVHLTATHQVRAQRSAQLVAIGLKVTVSIEFFDQLLDIPQVRQGLPSRILFLEALPFDQVQILPAIPFLVQDFLDREYIFLVGFRFQLGPLSGLESCIRLSVRQDVIHIVIRIRVVRRPLPLS